MLIRYRDGRFITYDSEDGLPHDIAVRIEEDEAGNLWMTWVGTVTRFDGERFQNFGPEALTDGVTGRAGPSCLGAPGGPTTPRASTSWSQDECAPTQSRGD